MSATLYAVAKSATRLDASGQHFANLRRSRLLCGTAIATGVIGAVMLAAPQSALADCAVGANFITCEDPPTETNAQTLNATADGWDAAVGFYSPPGSENPGTIAATDGPPLTINANSYSGDVYVSPNSEVSNTSGSGTRHAITVNPGAAASTNQTTINFTVDGKVDSTADMTSDGLRVSSGGTDPSAAANAYNVNVTINADAKVLAADDAVAVLGLTGQLNVYNHGWLEGTGFSPSDNNSEGLTLLQDGKTSAALAGDIYIDNTGTILGAKSGTVGSGIIISTSGNTHILNETGGHIEGGVHGIDISNSGHSDIENYSTTSIVGAQSGMTITDSSSSFTWNTGKIQGLGDEGIDVNDLHSLLVINNGVDKSFNADGANALIEGYWDGIDISGVSGGTTTIDTLPSFIAPGDYNTIVRNLNGAYVHGLHGDGVDILDGNNILVYNNNSTIRGGDGTGATGDEGVQIGESLFVGDEKKDTSYAVVFNTGSDALIQGRWDGVDIKDLWSDTKLRVDLPFADPNTTFFNSIVANFDDATIQGINGSGVDIFDGGNVLVYNDHASIIGGFLDGKATKASKGGDHGVEIDGGLLIGDYDVVYNTNNGLMQGNEDGVHIRNVVRDFNTAGDYVAVQPSGYEFTVTVLNNDGSTIQGTNGDGVDVKYVTGNVLVANQGGSDSYIIGNDNGVEVRHVSGGSGSEGSALGFVTISNNYLPTDGRAVIQGEGSWYHPILRVSDTDSNANIINGTNGIIIANERPDSFLNDLSTFTNFADTVDEAGMFSWSQFESVKSMLPAYYEVARDNLAKLDDIGYSISWQNDGWQVGRVKLEANQYITINNTGVWFDSGRNYFNAGKTSTINNTQHGWIQTALNGEEREWTSFYGLDYFNNTGSFLSMADMGAGDKTYISGNYNGADGYVGVDVHFGQPWSHLLTYDQQKAVLGKADELKIGGDISGTSGLIIEKTNTSPGGINLKGIKVVKFEGTDLGSTCYDTYCVAGDTMTIDENSQDFILVDGVPMVADGVFASHLTEKVTDYDDEFRLISDWGPLSGQLPTLLTQAQGIWYNTGDVVSDHLHGNTFPVGGSAGADDTMGMVSTETAKPTTGLWAKAQGDWTNRDTSIDYMGLTFDASYRQNTYGLLAGADFRPGGGDGPARIGVYGGYVNSNAKFDSWMATSKFDGGTVGGYVDLTNGGLYGNAEVKADFLNMDYMAPIGGGVSGAARTTSVGVRANVGYRMENTHAYLEPIASFAYVNTNIGDFSAGGAMISFSNGQSTRAGAGIRVGASLGGSGGSTTDVSLTGKVWDEFEPVNTVTLYDPLSMTSASFTDSIQGIFGEVKGEATFYTSDRLFSAFLGGGALFNSDFVTWQAHAGVRKSF
jgi:hypothetical protein